MAARRSARLSANGEGKATKDESTEMLPPPLTTTKSRKRKASQSAPAETEDVKPAPTTPRKRRVKSTVPPPPPATPTPSAVGLIAEPVINGTTTTPKPKSRAVNRLADPNATNAQLLSPETSRVVTSKAVDAVSPSKASTIRTTTANILEEACQHLIKVDARMKPLIDSHHCRIFSPEGLAEKIDPFESLCSGIISQQVSGAAARAIKTRFVALFDTSSSARNFPQPSQVAAMSIETLRTAGLSQRKAEYVQGLAAKFASGELTAQMLHDAPYDEVLEKLIAVRGLGRWSVEMFACFGLKRMDVFSLGDLGVQRGMAAFVGRDVAKLKSKGGKNKYMSEQEMAEISERFAPYRSLFMWYMWRVEETDISTLE